MMPTLIRRLNIKKMVVFHCMLSQQRGPTAALRYIREKEEHLKLQGGAPSSSTSGNVEQVVCVLEEGFSGWQREYGEDERLTEGYVKELWVDED